MVPYQQRNILFNSVATSLFLINFILPFSFLWLGQISNYDKQKMKDLEMYIWYSTSLHGLWLGYEKLNTTTPVHKNTSQILCGCYILKQIAIEHLLNTRFSSKKYIKLQCIIIIKIL